ncbi:hypothetical protein GCM10011376_05590 [Nocardioides flavus (ex Wang et al. 2016)]|uniref:Glycoprotein n=1 Tax=Nocardioides flavus (ex Wang et al. 2016) TaxID=2058780 RepID=A0ABQ3HII8_9ACTN|nr:hypothetical protein [Nocardioides flavus (ex Wang et al. 2016)]GHE15775.1 hypothetical protein GCM10011376_05590 [Nocardioides flavus (ex Wang et al. 2016)]
MPRPSVFRAALAGLLTLGVAGVGTPTPAKAAEDDADPLVVHIDTISPELPRSGDVEITGTVTNVSDDTYTRVNLHAFSSASPILDSATLSASATTDPAEYVGDRVLVPGTFDTVDTLEPGQTASFTDTVPVELLPASGEQGVYWIGVHALGDTAEVPRDGVADGRARTFIPTRPSGDETQEASVVLPIRTRVWYTEDGAVAGTERWARRLAEGGSLDGVLDMAESAGTTPYSWLVDPAVLLALVRLAEGNATRSLAPDPSVPGQEITPTETPTDGDVTPTEGVAPSTSPETLTPTEALPTEEPSEEDAELAAAASAWLARFTELVGSIPVLTLPYGDIDVSAAVRHDPARLEQAVARGNEIMAALGLPTQPAIAPSGDVLSPEALSAVPVSTVVMLGDNAFAIPPRSPNSVVRLLGHKVLVTSTGAEAGGPGPTAASDPLALRQRLLSEAALRLSAGDTAPLVVTLPTVWRGEDAASFFTDLEQGWLDVVPVGEVARRQAVGVPATSLLYTESDVEAELGASAFSTATRATSDATLLEQVLSSVTRVEALVRDEVLVTLSEQHRARPGLALAAARRVQDSLRDDLAKIEIEGPTAVTLSGDSGPLGATLVNGLDQPVEVQVLASTDGRLTLTGGGVRRLAPQARSVVRFEATTSRAGVHNVRLSVTSLDGVPLGSSDELPIRAARVSALIWIAMAGGALVLFGMIGYRLPGQIRQRRAELAAAEARSAEEQPT